MRRRTTAVLAFSVAMTSAMTVHAQDTGYDEQDAASDEPRSRKKFTRFQSTLFVEVGGPGIYYSVNYGFRMGPRDSGISLTVGASVADVIRVPFGVSVVFGREDALEVGLSYALTDDERETTFGALIGYRYQPEGEDIFFRIGLVPLVPLNPRTGFLSMPPFWVTVGVAMGGTF